VGHLATRGSSALEHLPPWCVGIGRETWRGGWIKQQEARGISMRDGSSDLPFLDAQHLVLWLLVLGTRQGHRHPERRWDRAGGDFHRLLPHPVRCPEHGWFCPTLNVVLRTRPEVYSLPLVIPTSSTFEYYLEGPLVLQVTIFVLYAFFTEGPC
jgi:hypothetical protein